jgi:hypothetical protein
LCLFLPCLCRLPSLCLQISLSLLHPPPSHVCISLSFVALSSVCCTVFFFCFRSCMRAQVDQRVVCQGRSHSNPNGTLCLLSTVGSSSRENLSGCCTTRESRLWEMAGFPLQLDATPRCFGLLCRVKNPLTATAQEGGQETTRTVFQRFPIQYKAPWVVPIQCVVRLRRGA